jgi:hypothetical protein
MTFMLSPPSVALAVVRGGVVAVLTNSYLFYEYQGMSFSGASFSDR